MRSHSLLVCACNLYYSHCERVRPLVMSVNPTNHQQHMNIILGVQTHALSLSFLLRNGQFVCSCEQKKHVNSIGVTKSCVKRNEFLAIRKFGIFLFRSAHQVLNDWLFSFPCFECNSEADFKLKMITQGTCFLCATICFRQVLL